MPNTLKLPGRRHYQVKIILTLRHVRNRLCTDPPTSNTCSGVSSSAYARCTWHGVPPGDSQIRLSVGQAALNEPPHARWPPRWHVPIGDDLPDQAGVRTQTHPDADLETVRRLLGNYIDAARRTGGRKNRDTTPQASAPTINREQTNTIRDWARKNGFELSDCSRIPHRH
jgi:hypothetical protein